MKSIDEVLDEELNNEMIELMKQNPLFRSRIIDAMYDYAKEYHSSQPTNKSEIITHFVEWLKDNHSIELPDMIVQDYIKYGNN